MLGAGLHYKDAAAGRLMTRSSPNRDAVATEFRIMVKWAAYCVAEIVCRAMMLEDEPLHPVTHRG
ncbi:hypothetical protein EEB11_18870 [Pseudotabrizicola sediminis]|uniref:Uncharacterized protein n=1 Tax=Pseudotabrizicola sediminis TaxID=2486418 RepID=A0ABY2KGM2_9RHOB|nr:hypothetical protein EEB11_18870 [Pseudotabrizicola sediminis]